MLINELSRDECFAIFGRVSLGRLGCAVNDRPYVVPIFFAYESGYIYAFSTLGQKIQWMRTNPNVCMQVDEIVDDCQWTSVIINGRYQELREPQFTGERAQARKLLDKRYRWWQAAFAERQMKSEEGLIDPLFFRISIDSITGLRAQAV